MTPGDWQEVKALFDRCVDLPLAGRSEFLKRECRDADQRREVESLLAAHLEAGEFIEVPILQRGSEATQGARWLLLELVGSGGMGEIYRARRADVELDQQVAVKLLHRGLDTQAIVRHFQTERQILAKMEHPNIARFLDAGVTADDRPFFAMEFIEGVPIDEFAGARNLSVRQRLELFRSVCSAVSYAHKLLVVHRDIKPANILVTAEGVPKLLDFGIAKVLSPTGPGVTQTQPMLTPEYASPEQIKGEVITTAADVYSLGVLLYQLLSGAKPYQVSGDKPVDLIAAICEREPIPPSAAAGGKRGRELEGDLDNIVLKALEKDPARRYESVDQFSEDIRRHLEGYPVIARKATLGYRATRFVRRRKGLVAAAAAIILSLSGGLAATAWQARLARAEKAEAERRFQELRKLARSVLFEFHDAISDLPGATPARALLLKNALEYLDKLSTMAPKDPAIRLELAEAYLRAGDVAGGNGSNNLGDIAGANHHYQRAIELLEATTPKSNSLQRMLAKAYNRQPGEDFARKALAIYEQLYRLNPNAGPARSDLATGYYYLAMAASDQGKLEEAIQWREKEVPIRRLLYTETPNDKIRAGNYALSEKRLGALLIRVDRLEEAARHYESAIEIETSVLQRDPHSSDTRLGLSFSHSDLALILTKQKKGKEALEHYHTALKFREEIAASDPKNIRAAYALASLYGRIGNAYSEITGFPAAEPWYRKALAFYDHLPQPLSTEAAAARKEVEKDLRGKGSK